MRQYGAVGTMQATMVPEDLGCDLYVCLKRQLRTRRSSLAIWHIRMPWTHCTTTVFFGGPVPQDPPPGVSRTCRWLLAGLDAPTLRPRPRPKTGGGWWIIIIGEPKIRTPLQLAAPWRHWCHCGVRGRRLEIRARSRPPMALEPFDGG
jgi:hypothetical protein